MEVKVIGQMDNTIDHTFESANRVYDVGGVSPTINTCGGGGLQPKILEDMNPRLLGGIGEKWGNKQYRQGNRVYDSNGVAMALTAQPLGNNGGNSYMYLTEEKSIVTMRGRNPNNPSDRTVGSPTEQRLEPNSQGLCNTLTSVQKDNLVMEKVVIDDTYANRQPRVYEDYSPALRSEREGLKTIEVKQLGFMDNGTGKHQSNTVYDEKALCPNITTIEGGGTQQIKVMTENVYDFYNNNLKSDGVCGTLTSACSHNGSGTFGVIEQQYRIRKLTSKECWRLMDFTDEDFEKAAQVNSNTQLYKQAGNSIVKNVLVAILGQMIPGKEEVYKKLETR